MLLTSLDHEHAAISLPAILLVLPVFAFSHIDERDKGNGGIESGTKDSSIYATHRPRPKLDPWPGIVAPQLVTRFIEKPSK